MRSASPVRSGHEAEWVADSSTIVVKIGGSTFGSGETTLADVAALRAAGRNVVLVHGGGAEITRWLGIHRVESRFVDGLRVTDEAAIDVVVAVLAGMVNKKLVAQLDRLGVPALGLCGPDGGVLRGAIEQAALGLVGEVYAVGAAILHTLLAAGLVPVIAPIAVERGSDRLLNVNGDTAAGQVAAALSGARLVFLTDVPGVLDATGATIAHLDATRSAALRHEGVLKGA